MKLYKTQNGTVLEHNGGYYISGAAFDTLINRNNLYGYLLYSLAKFSKLSEEEVAIFLTRPLLAPIGTQEVWAAGVTYLRSRDARMEESKESGGATFYDKVYEAERPELFFKSLPHRVAGHFEDVYIRRDSTWNVPEPELTLFINSAGNIQAYTIGNDMSSRSIEGENPLYLPQAKTYERSAALGPCLYIPEYPIDTGTTISMNILRNNQSIFEGAIKLSMMKRSLPELAAFLFRETDFPSGCFLMTGTCLVPDNDFTLLENDIVNISIDEIGTLLNRVMHKPLAV
ncbi:fumarylacetoacetate hydrolase family protein [Agriterribacter sp.]|uniref:fumarylacetoacetate hydrolase family protein n=1 Tax=Agriterribacter sp. TaxID=2821509 RepID=UPI002C413438|nr:fumarylacetoacetate hydrolase family protein [Agriterribacter sp.]HTN05900.1 fumarylacetoacetate hydrolase family protein [Agriterribacter sp.]